mmetsp:Transcript_45789/g.133337  ORF Transcript_45789/g.133337 Transcript_45789/m.133337 type:complete len:97 (+) Transcript_45789:289-579(+)
MRLSKACCTARSASTSKELVASSRIKIGASFKMARAIVNLCFCPPESCEPRGPTSVCKPSGNFWTNSQASARLQASMILLSSSAAATAASTSSSRA